ncbi:nucleotidyltransferase domain-containing protein [Lysinibacillus fusiformis]|uniref:nucleotidyltransferase domain-containing protein n=1 Tax=Lysinibacillus fusiformis TaxID=28031 RepID=UPI001EF43E25|nr:nucleotidyltransferase domain-containing protein [Lysinibacillus fusiformis]MCG7436698.1 nucleotidyltransferase domain-containing protein [Lysinibacillus fusiformis]
MTLANWRKALETFLNDWQGRDEVVGALVCGSYVTGHPSERSDIDVHIILSNDVKWRERGNQIVDGFLIEYFANPPGQIRRYFQDDFNKHRTMSMVQFQTGQILFDYTGIINELKLEAYAWQEKNYETINKTVLKLKKYGLWDMLDNTKDCYEQKRGDFIFVYHHALATLFMEYGQFLNVDTIPTYQIHAYLVDPIYLQKYMKSAFPDEHFKQMFLHALKESNTEQMLESLEALVSYVLKQMGGFCIDGWHVKSPIEG